MAKVYTDAVFIFSRHRAKLKVISANNNNVFSGKQEPWIA